MAIYTLDKIIAGAQMPQDFLKVGAATVAGRFYSPFYVAGRPGAAVAPSSGVGGTALTGYTGQIPFINPVSGNTYLARFAGNATAAGSLILADRLWHNSGINVTLNTSQTINSVNFPERDNNISLSGEGVMIAVEVSTVMGAGTPTFTLNYTNSAGVSGRTITTAAQTATMAVGSFIPIQLMAGDTGVKSIQSFQLSATMTSGALHLVAYRQITRVDITSAGLGNSVDSISSGFPRFVNDSVPFLLWLPATTTAPTISGQLVYTQG